MQHGNISKNTSTSTINIYDEEIIFLYDQYELYDQHSFQIVISLKKHALVMHN